MGAPAVTTPARRARPRPATKPRTAPKSRAAAKPRSAKPRASAAPRTAPRRTRNTPAAGFAMIPVTAVGRTAGAVSGLADSGVVHSLTRSRAWIVVLGILLGGIVAVNLYGLGLSAGGGQTAAKIDELQRHNGILHSRIAQRTSGEKVELAAAALGLAVPAPDAVTYLSDAEENAARAAERLANGRIALAPPPIESTADVDPATGLPVETTEPVVADPAAVAPVEAEVAPVDPVTGLPTEPTTP